jgi:vWA-MoxR associated protein C-terminal domain
MIEWNSINQGKFRKVLLDFYQSNTLLREFVRDNLSVDLQDLPDFRATAQSQWTGELLEVSASVGWIKDLYELFCSTHLGDPRLVKLRADLNDPALEQPIGEEGSHAIVRSPVESTVEPELSEDPFSTHLVIAMFWQERQKQKFRIHPKFCYRASGTHAILEEPLVKDNPSLPLKDFPNFLQNLVDFTITKLAKLYPDPTHPWKLTIELFVPVDLMGQPLSTWCGQTGALLINHPIVIGCSDRFDSDRQAEAFTLHNQLKHGWQRFQAKAPDQAGSTLKSLSWITSDTAHREALEDYAGFQCYGGWLRSDEDSLDNWQELVRSGIPLALWMCQGTPQRADTVTTFDRLINGTRFEFLRQIPLVRNQQRRTCDHCVGVFYEDPNYLPDIPVAKEEQFFSWPGA